MSTPELPYVVDADIPLSPEELNVLRKQYLREGKDVTTQTKFNYAWGLIKSKKNTEQEEGVKLLKDIFKESKERRRECLFYLALGHNKLGHYNIARSYNNELLSMDPENSQALSLKKKIEDSLNKEGKLGIAIAACLTTIAVVGTILVTSLGRRNHIQFDKNKYFPTIGVTILEIDNDSYSTNGKDDEELDDLIKQFDTALTVQGRFSSFKLSNKLIDYIDFISGEVEKAEQVDFENKEIRFMLYFGRELFMKIPQNIINVKDWFKIKRGGRFGIRTTFQHDASIIMNKLDLIKEQFGFREHPNNINLNGKPISITIYYLDEEKEKKIKLHWDKINEIWKITESKSDMKRNALIDIISGDSRPDLRFSVKTQTDIKVSDDIIKVIEEVQLSKSMNPNDLLYFRKSDFVNKLEIVSIRQKMNKKRYTNEKFQITINTMLQDAGEESVEEQKIFNLKYLTWKSFYNNNENTNGNNRNNRGKPINKNYIFTITQEIIEYGREIVKFIF
ncbi:366_t:CDS:2 [Entrophospora sp. SA101]|nr:366_t:CDS:2 [Entrophospora sp. SA101]